MICKLKSKVVVTHWIHQEVIDYLAADHDLVLNQTKDTQPRTVIEQQAKDARAIMVFMPDAVDEAFLTACPDLEIIAGALKGYDNFDIDACTRHGVWFAIVPDLLTVPVAELALCLMIGISRHVLSGDHLVRSGAFQGWRPALYGTGLAGSTVGIIGMGAVGTTLARLLRVFDARVLYFDVNPISSEEERKLGVSYVDLVTLFNKSTFILPLTPLNESTHHIINRDRIRVMKPGSYIVNVARGSVVDECAVADALESGHLGGYAADVFEMEDWSRSDRPREVPQALVRQKEKTLFTPHLGSGVDEVRREIALQAAENIQQALQGLVPRGAVNRLPPRQSG